MVRYDVKRLLTVVDCNALLQKAGSSVNILKIKQGKLQHRVDVHRRTASKAKEELQLREIDLQALTVGLLQLGEGRLAREYSCKIAKTQWRIKMLELRLEDYSEQALLLKELELYQVNAALSAAELLMEEINARRKELQQLSESDQTTVSTTLEPQNMLSSIAERVKELRHPQKPESAERFLKKWSVKPLHATRQFGAYS